MTAEGLLKTVNNSLSFLQVETLDDDNVGDEAVSPGVVSRVINKNSNRKLVGMGTDGASNIVAARGLKGLVEQNIFWM